MESVLIVLEQLQFGSYLPSEDFINFRRVSKLCNKISLFMKPLHIPFFCEKLVTEKIIEMCKKTKKIFWNFTTAGNINMGLFKYIPFLSLTYIKFGDNFNSEITFKNLPQTLTHLTVGYHFNQRVDNLPPSLLFLHFGKQFNQPIDHLPSGLHFLLFCCYDLHVECSGDFDQSVDNLPKCLKLLYIRTTRKVVFNNLPSSLVELSIFISQLTYISSLPPSLIRLNTMGEFYFKESQSLRCIRLFGHTIASFPHTTHLLQFPQNFNDEINSKLPPNLVYLLLGTQFNGRIDNLPPSLKHLDFPRDSCFNQPIENLPENLKFLYLGLKFNHPINKLPPKLLALRIAGVFSHPADNLPPLLKKLTLRYFLENWESLKIVIDRGIPFPSTLKELNFCILGHKLPSVYERKVQGMVDNLPSSIINLALSCPAPYLDHLPPNISTLILQFCPKLKNLDHLPESVWDLELFRNSYNIPLDHLPPSLTCLNMDQNVSIDYLPQGIRRVFLCGSFDRKVDHLPLSMTSLSFIDGTFSQPLDNLPSSLQYLSIKNEAKKSQPLDHLPKNLKTLKLNGFYNRSLEYLPAGLTCLELGYGFQMSTDHFPISLTKLTINATYKEEAYKKEHLTEVQFVAQDGKVFFPEK